MLFCCMKVMFRVMAWTSSHSSYDFNFLFLTLVIYTTEGAKIKKKIIIINNNNNNNNSRKCLKIVTIVYHSRRNQRQRVRPMSAKQLKFGKIER